MVFTLWWSCEHPSVLADDTFHRPDCPAITSEHEHLELEAMQPVERDHAPGRCWKCYPDTRLVGAPPDSLSG